ncbi:MAG: CHAT domain-containing protein [Microcoleus sp.]
MAKLVILKIGQGNFDRGFPVILQVGEDGFRPSIEVTGQLPANPEIVGYYQQWQSIYLRLGGCPRLEIRKTQITSSSEFSELIGNCRNAAETLNRNLESWLNSETFRPIKERLLETLTPSEPIRVIIQTADLDLRRLPWHLWQIFDRYDRAEVALSSPDYEKIAKTHFSAHKNMRILAILGDSKGIDIEADRRYLESLPRAEITFLPEPQRKDINDRLWEQDWDILFFAGHSKTEKEKGIIYINSRDSLTIGDLKQGLKKTIDKGLQLAIFNSCDGLGLARELEDLHIPQIIVMREQIPDNVAQKFLKYFLSAFSSGQSLYLAVRQARERLCSEGLDDEIPGATWLPIICQNLAATPLTWFSHQKQKTKNYRLLVAAFVILISAIGTIAVAKNSSLFSRFLTGQSSEIAKKFKSYENPSYGFRIKYPERWDFQKIEDPSTKEVVQFFPVNEHNSSIASQFKVIVRLESLNKNMSLDEYRNSAEKEIKQFLPEAQIIDLSQIILAKQQGYKLVYSGKSSQNNLLKKMEVVTLYKGQAYIITYEAEIEKYSDYLKTVQEMINSFEIIDANQ